MNAPCPLKLAGGVSPVTISYGTMVSSAMLPKVEQVHDAFSDYPKGEMHFHADPDPGF
jgi:hypothetical protein